MSKARDISRLWRLVDDSLRLYRQLDVAMAGKEKERELLLALSQVFRRVQLWNQEADSDSDNGSGTRLDCESGFSGNCRSNSEEIHCLSKIIVDLVCLMAVNNRYVQHLAGNVLLVVSEFLAQCGSNWEAFIQFLCVSLDLAINTLILDSSMPLLAGAEDSDSTSSSFVLAVKDKLKSANLLAVAGIVRVLRCILKHLTLEDDARLIRVYFDSVNSCLSNVRWDSFSRIFCALDGKAQKSSVSDAPCEKLVFLGYLIQLLCSLVEQSGAVKAAGSSTNKHQVLSLTIIVVPKFLSWCVGKQGDSVNKSIVQYFRHKLLVLMIRLSFQTSLDCSILVSFLQLLQQYFGDILRQPITSLESVQNESLEGSPFPLSVSDEVVNSLSFPHVQRQAIFLFLRCTFSLVNLSSGMDNKCICGTKNLYLPCDSNVELECCGRKRGLIELKNWLQWHLPADIYLSQEMYLRKCIDFSLSFLQLYMHEDDLLFRVLLELFLVPFSSDKKFLKEKAAFQYAEHDILCHVSNLFNHVHLFHLFLAELHYDHQVLLDYLISKDTGISSAEYLLRCLRAVCDSWHVFVEFCVCGEFVNQSSHKKRKVIWDDSASQSQAQTQESSMAMKNDQVLTLLGKECKGGYENGGEQYHSAGRPYNKAKECLVALLVSIESLRQKNLFPYNPKVLLKRLRTFQELCCQEEQNYL